MYIHCAYYSAFISPHEVHGGTQGRQRKRLNHTTIYISAIVNFIYRHILTCTIYNVQCRLSTAWAVHYVRSIVISVLYIHVYLCWKLLSSRSV